MNKMNENYVHTCLYCKRSSTETGVPFKTMKNIGYSCCQDCWDMGIPDHTTVYIRPEVLAAIHNGVRSSNPDCFANKNNKNHHRVE